MTLHWIAETEKNCEKTEKIWNRATRDTDRVGIDNDDGVIMMWCAVQCSVVFTYFSVVWLWVIKDDDDVDDVILICSAVKCSVVMMSNQIWW